MRKAYVEVVAEFSREGQIYPRILIWEDGRRFAIDRILDRRPAASLKAGGVGIRYTCLIRNKQVFLYLEENKWFVEAQ